MKHIPITDEEWEVIAFLLSFVLSIVKANSNAPFSRTCGWWKEYEFMISVMEMAFEIFSLNSV